MGLMIQNSAEERLDILVVDDSPTYRMILSRAVKGFAWVQLVGSAGDGESALVAIRDKRPNLVLLDVSMPVLDGIETLRRIRAEWLEVDVIMCSGLDSSQTGLTMQALSLGALDFIPKPQGENPTESFAALSASLSPLLDLALSRKRRRLSRMKPQPAPPVAAPAVPRQIAAPKDAPKAIAAPSPAPARPVPPPTASPVASRDAPRTEIRSHVPDAIPSRSNLARKLPAKIELVVFGVSTGGPNALHALVPKLPGNFPVPIVCVQHMPPLFTASLAERLDRDAALSVQEARDGAIVGAGTFLIAPGGRHLAVVRAADGRFRAVLRDDPPVHSCRPSVDILFQSACEAAPGATVSVILTGMGSDGADGTRSLRSLGGWSIVQDEATSVVWGMPGAVHALGQVDETLPIEAIAQRLTEIVERRGGAR